MCIKNIKYYLKPLGYFPNREGYYQKKKNKAIEINNSFYSLIELIIREKKILKKIYSIEDFQQLILKNKNEKLSYKFNELIKKRKNLLSNKNYFKKSKKHLIFGILNTTPDSFSDGGENILTNKAFENALRMSQLGADFIDIGGESTRPGAEKVDEVEECLRVLPIIQLLKSKNIKLSLDTRNASTMKLGILNGIRIINDVSALKHSKESINVLKKYNVPFILMHMPGTPKTMMKRNKYEDVSLDVYDFLEERVNFCESNGLKKENIIIDPGIGFGKDLDQNVSLLKNLSIFHGLGCPIMLGVSRKRFITSISKEDDPRQRVGGTISATLLAMKQGVQIHRVHDVKEINQAIKVFEKINNS